MKILHSREISPTFIFTYKPNKKYFKTKTDAVSRFRHRSPFPHHRLHYFSPVRCSDLRLEPVRVSASRTPTPSNGVALDLNKRNDPRWSVCTADELHQFRLEPRSLVLPSLHSDGDEESSAVIIVRVGDECDWIRSFS